MSFAPYIEYKLFLKKFGKDEAVKSMFYYHPIRDCYINFLLKIQYILL